MYIQQRITGFSYVWLWTNAALAPCAREGHAHRSDRFLPPGDMVGGEFRDNFEQAAKLCMSDFLFNYLDNCTEAHGE